MEKGHVTKLLVDGGVSAINILDVIVDKGANGTALICWQNNAGREGGHFEIPAQAAPWESEEAMVNWVATQLAGLKRQPNCPKPFNTNRPVVVDIVMG